MKNIKTFMKLILRKIIVRLRMFWADIRGHHGKVWDYEPGDYYMGRKKDIENMNNYMKKIKKDKDKLIEEYKLDTWAFIVFIIIMGVISL